eukprot:TRINITY_DN1785_c0_g3_i1.p1 TRINITY_DN1785_c0_g3~~TRINITY_DN1785_c0_g3_i1.p1  ORF type:complete len:841 (-),score=305.99 TRINITY_DN1785_c0_g3_i1:168-2690(-)
MGDDLIVTAEILNSLIEQGGRLVYQKHISFWAALETSEGVTSYVTCLLVKFLALDLSLSSSFVDLVRNLTLRSPPSLDKNASVQPEDKNLKNSIICTLNYLGLFHRLNHEDPHLKYFLESWSLFLSEKAKAELEEVTKNFNSFFAEGNDIIVNLLYQCSDINNVSTIADINDLTPQQLSHSMINSYLRLSLLKNHQTKFIFDNLFVFLKHHSLIPPNRLLVLLHIVNQFVSYTPHATAEHIQTALSLCKSFYLWPSPHGDYARELMQILSIEAKAPGTAFRKAIIDENPMLRGNPGTGNERVVYVIYDPTLPLAIALRDFIELTRQNESSPQQLKLDFLAHMIESNINPTTPVPYEEMAEEAVSRFCEAALDILDQTVLVSQEQSEEFRRRQMHALVDDIINFVNTQQRQPSLNIKPKPMQFPSVKFHFISVQPEILKPFHPNQLETSQRYPKREIQEIICKIVAQDASVMVSEEKVVIRFMVMGDHLMHKVTSVFTTMRHPQHELSKVVKRTDIRFFFIPCDSGSFGGWLVKRDPWYARHALALPQAAMRVIPSKLTSTLTSMIDGSLSLIPNKSPSAEKSKSEVSSPSGRSTISASQVPSAKLSVRAASSKNINGEYVKGGEVASIIASNMKITPSFILRLEFENFVREAKVKNEIQLFQCECYSPDGFYFTMPFFKSAEIGYKTWLRVTEEDPNYSSSKSLKYVAPFLALKFTQMNLSGVSRTTPPIESQYYHSISIINVPNNPNQSADPTKPWLEVTAVEVDKKHKGKPSMREMDPTLIAHVGMIEVEWEDRKKGESFHILLDDISYGPFNRVKITNVGGLDNPQSLSFMSFLPEI